MDETDEKLEQKRSDLRVLVRDVLDWCKAAYLHDPNKVLERESIERNMQAFIDRATEEELQMLALKIEYLLQAMRKKVG